METSFVGFDTSKHPSTCLKHFLRVSELPWEGWESYCMWSAFQKNPWPKWNLQKYEGVLNAQTTSIMNFIPINIVVLPSISLLFKFNVPNPLGAYLVRNNLPYWCFACSVCILLFNKKCLYHIGLDCFHNGFIALLVWGFFKTSNQNYGVPMPLNYRHWNKSLLRTVYRFPTGNRLWTATIFEIQSFSEAFASAAGNQNLAYLGFKWPHVKTLFYFGFAFFLWHPCPFYIHRKRFQTLTVCWKVLGSIQRILPKFYKTKSRGHYNVTQLDSARTFFEQGWFCRKSFPIKRRWVNRNGLGNYFERKPSTTVPYQYERAFDVVKETNSTKGLQ